MRKFITGLVAAAALCGGVAQPAKAYLHLANAQAGCGYLTPRTAAASWFSSQGDVYWTFVTKGTDTDGYERIDDNTVRVLCAHLSNGSRVYSVNAVVTGPDGSEWVNSWSYCYRGYTSLVPGGWWGCAGI